MRIMVTGSRDWRDVGVIADALWETVADGESDRMGDYTLVHGCASGADAIARSVAVARGMTVDDYWPDYAGGLSFAEANKRRNIEMVKSDPDIVLAFPTKRSRGTWHAVNAAKRAGIEIRILEHP